MKRPGEELVSKAAHLSVVEEPTADEVDAYERRPLVSRTQHRF